MTTKGIEAVLMKKINEIKSNQNLKEYSTLRKTNRLAPLTYRRNVSREKTKEEQRELEKLALSPTANYDTSSRDSSTIDLGENPVSEESMELLLCVGRNDREKAIQIIERDQSLINTKDFIYGNSLLHWSIKMNDFTFSEYLVKKGIDINMKNNIGQTSLHLSVIENNEEVVKLICSHFSTNINAMDFEYMKPFDYITEETKPNIKKFLCKEKSTKTEEVIVKSIKPSNVYDGRKNFRKAQNVVVFMKRMKTIHKSPISKESHIALSEDNAFSKTFGYSSKNKSFLGNPFLSLKLKVQSKFKSHSHDYLPYLKNR